MNGDIYIFKLHDPGKRWEDTEVWCRRVDGTLNGETPDELAHRLATQHGVEVRWNVDGSQQGHYVSPQMLTEA